MRLIDADALEKQMRRTSPPIANLPMLRAMPTVDAVEAVRCKYCRHMTLENGIRWCNVWDRPNGYGDDGFCNYGERRDDD